MSTLDSHDPDDWDFAEMDEMVTNLEAGAIPEVTPTGLLDADELAAIHDRKEHAWPSGVAAEDQDCRCGDSPHENAIHDIVVDDVPALLDHIRLLTTVITDLADADAALQPIRWGAATGDVRDARHHVTQALSALRDVAKVIR